MAFGLTFSVLCGEDLYRVDEQVLARDAQSFLQATTLKQWTEFCPLLNITRREPLSTEPIAAPTLLLSGALDPVTPPTRAEQAKQFMTQAQHHIAPNVGHIVSTAGCAPTLLKQFVDEPTQALDLPLTAFRLLLRDMQCRLPPYGQLFYTKV
jgi:pimeloyl-ACP methyl ester carboxylesterase